MLIPRRRAAEAPLSFAQERPWFLAELGEGAATPSTSVALRLVGSLDAAALERSLGELVRRHEALRTSFTTRDGQPIQRPLAARSFELGRTDLSGRPAASRLPGALRLASEESRRAFDLGRDLLLRAHLGRLSPEEHLLLLAAHPLACDERSLEILLRELALLYGAFAEGRPSPLPEPGLQYADFALWERAWLKGENFDRPLSYWRRRLEGAPAVLELPADRPRPPVPTLAGGVLAFDLPEAPSEAIRVFGGREGIPVESLLLAAFVLLLGRYAGREDLLVGSPTSGRWRAETSDLVGFFVNTVVLRADLSGDPPFADLARRCDETVRQARQHELPFARLVAELQPDRDLSHNPFFQVMFSMRPPQAPLRRLGPLEAQPLEIEGRIANFDLTLEVTDGPRLCAALEYGLDLFDDATIARMSGHFQALCEGISSDPWRRISGLSLLTQEERRKTVVVWNDSRAAWPREKCVHRLFEEQVDRTPEAIALQFGEDVLTYRELDRRANRIANHLRRFGAGPEVFVALCLPRSFDMVAALLGILKAGGAYVPLDPTYPRERLAFLLEDVRPAMLLTHETLAGILPASSGRLVFLDSGGGTIAGESEDRPSSGVLPENIACVLHTSGSTGKPKGALVPHRAIVNHNVAMARGFRLEARDRVLQFASINFDASLEELFPSWSVGARVVLRADGVFPTDDLMRLIETAGLTVLDLPTAWWHAWVYDLAASRRALPTSLRLVIVGGEKASRERFAAWRRFGGADRVSWINTYGPTEATVVATAWEAPPAEPAPGDLPIGRPIANVRVYLLDRGLEPVPPGIAGELYIGGPGVARGYWGRPDLTAERFVPDPFAEEPGMRLYRTGDWGRWRADGQVEFLGRRDDQVKIQGYRIELGEIEAALSEHPGFLQAVVLAREDTPGARRLVAYVARGRDGNPDTGELRRFLRGKLPEYMVPSAFVVVEALPLTPSGKVNRRALPAPEPGRPELSEAYEAPRTPVERVVAEVWGEVLGVERVGVRDNFFELGGHSLLATRVVSRLRETLDLDLPLRVLFEAPTVSGVALTIAQRQAESAPPGEIERLLAELEGSPSGDSGHSLRKAEGTPSP